MIESAEERGTLQRAGGEGLSRRQQRVRPLNSGRVLDLLLLTWAAGTMDALSYIRAGVFTANMTGNTVVLGLALAGSHRSRLFPCAVSICCFGVGTLIAAVVLTRLVRPQDEKSDLRVGIALELPFALGFWLLSSLGPQNASHIGAFLIATAACGLGIQSVAVRQLRISGVVTTFITGTITTALVSLVDKGSQQSGGNSDGHSPLLLAVLFVFYIVAAAVGGALESRHRVIGSAFPWLALACVLFRSLQGGRSNAIS